MARRKRLSAPKKDDKKAEALADRWLRLLRNNPVIAAIIVLATVTGAVIGFWDKLSNFYSGHVEPPVSVTAFNISAEADMLERDDFRFGHILSSGSS